MGWEQDLVIRFFLYSQFHGKDKPVGSDYIRAIQTIKYWDAADVYKYGENPECLIFMKVFCSPDYQFPNNFKGKKILDICDPMWLEGYDVVETCNAVDAVAVPTEPLAEFIRQFHNNVYVIPDRFDLELIPEPKEHIEEAKTVVWFGYSHNAELLKPAVRLIEELGLHLIIVSNDDPMVHRWSSDHTNHWYEYLKYEEDKIYEVLKRADFAVLPDGFRPQDMFKSNNKTIKANLCGLPVAKTAEEVREFIKPEARRKWFDENYATIKEQYDIRKSVDQYRDIINKISEK